MATATNRKTPAPQPPKKPVEATPPSGGAADHWILRAFDSVYRFLASLKLAVLCILTLAAVLAGATIFESFHTMAASRQYIYQHPLFAILLAFLGTNIFCAATIRYPWKKRQTGFVITHVGLLVVLAGSFVSLRFGQEGQVSMAEGTVSGELLRTDDAVVRVQKLDPATGKVLKPYLLPINPGVFAWDNDRLTAQLKDPEYRQQILLSRSGLSVSLLGLAAFVLLWSIRRPAWITPLIGSLITCALIGSSAGFGVFTAMTPSALRFDVLSDEADPFTLVVKDYLPSSLTKKTVAEPDREGFPLAKIALLATPPGSEKSFDAFDGSGWFGGSDPQIGRSAMRGGGATVVYQFVQGHHSPDLIDDFLNPPKDPLKQRAARIHYRDQSGKNRVYEWLISPDLLGKSVSVPDSEIQVTLAEFKDPILGGDAMGRRIRSATGDGQMHLAVFKIRNGAKPEREQIAISSLPMFPGLESQIDHDEGISISYFHPPDLSEAGGPMNARMAQIEVLSDEDGRFYLRAFNRDGLASPPGPIAVGKDVEVATKSRMGKPLVLRIDDYIPKGQLREVFTPVELPFALRENATPAIQAEMTVNGITKKVSLLRTSLSIPNDVHWETVNFGDEMYRVAYDFDRQEFRPSPFTLRLKKFEPGKDPGSGSFATYRSDVELTDPQMGLTDDPRVITMNEPLTHRGWTFYQQSFNRVPDPETGERDGVYASFFQVHYDPAWQIIYSGCLLVVIGTFVQFYMRAGVFTDGGKRERERAEARQALAEAKKSGIPAKPQAVKPTADEAESLEDL